MLRLCKLHAAIFIRHKVRIHQRTVVTQNYRTNFYFKNFIWAVYKSRSRPMIRIEIEFFLMIDYYVSSWKKKLLQELSLSLSVCVCVKHSSAEIHREYC